MTRKDLVRIKTFIKLKYDIQVRNLNIRLDATKSYYTITMDDYNEELIVDVGDSIYQSIDNFFSIRKARARFVRKYCM